MKISDINLKEGAQLLFITSNGCSSCWALKPKVEALLAKEFPKIQFCHIEVEQEKEWCAQQRILSAPTLLLYFDGHEQGRYGSAISTSELRQIISRPYSLLFA